MGTIYHVAILVLQLKPQYTYWKLDFRHESRRGASSSPIRDTLANVPGPHYDPWIFRAGPLLLLRINYFRTHVSRSLQTYIRGASYPTTTQVKSI